MKLQTYVEKISGAKLPIVTAPNPQVSVQIYVGQSPHTDKLNITAEGLKYGAYRIVSGDNWLALIGDDTDFTPIEPWPRSNNDIVSGKMQAAWDEITGATLGLSAVAAAQALHRQHGTLRHTANEQHVNARWRRERLGLRRTRIVQRGLRFLPTSRRALVPAG